MDDHRNKLRLSYNPEITRILSAYSAFRKHLQCTKYFIEQRKLLELHSLRFLNVDALSIAYSYLYNPLDHKNMYEPDSSFK